VELLIDELTAASPEAGSTCSLENYLLLPDHTMDGRIAAAREKLGVSTILLGHHYQRDEVIRFADFTGDSYKLLKAAAETDARYIIFCGVHFMAESADVLGRDGQQVILPDLNAGCSMADMAEISQVEACWEALARLSSLDEIVPITYMNSTAAIKAFCGERSGLVCTSSNARAAFEWLSSAASASCSFPTSTWAATPDTPWGFLSRKWRSGIPGRSRAARPRPN
jgi:quinolinate synthase